AFDGENLRAALRDRGAGRVLLPGGVSGAGGERASQRRDGQPREKGSHIITHHLNHSTTDLQGCTKDAGVKECWSVGVLECWSVGADPLISIPIFHHSITPSLHHSIPPTLRHS